MSFRNFSVKSLYNSAKLHEDGHAFHGSNRGSNPRGDATSKIHKLAEYPSIQNTCRAAEKKLLKRKAARNAPGLHVSHREVAVRKAVRK